MTVYRGKEEYMQTGEHNHPQERAQEHLQQEEAVTMRLSTSGLPSHEYDVADRPASNRNDLLGLALIGIGVLALVSQFLPSAGDMTAGVVLLTIASCFLFFAFWQRIYGLLIPGSILSGLSVGVPFAGVTHGVSVLWGLSLGFFAILFLGRSMFSIRCQWPVYPAIILFGVGVIVAASTLPTWLTGGIVWLPILLILSGLYLGWLRNRNL